MFYIIFFFVSTVSLFYILAATKKCRINKMWVYMTCILCILFIAYVGYLFEPCSRGDFASYDTYTFDLQRYHQEIRDLRSKGYDSFVVEMREGVQPMRFIIEYIFGLISDKEYIFTAFIVFAGYLIPFMSILTTKNYLLGGRKEKYINISHFIISVYLIFGCICIEDVFNVYRAVIAYGLCGYASLIYFIQEKKILSAFLFIGAVLLQTSSIIFPITLLLYCIIPKVYYFCWILFGWQLIKDVAGRILEKLPIAIVSRFGTMLWKNAKPGGRHIIYWFALAGFLLWIVYIIVKMRKAEKDIRIKKYLEFMMIILAWGLGGFGNIFAIRSLFFFATLIPMLVYNMGNALKGKKKTISYIFILADNMVLVVYLLLVFYVRIVTSGSYFRL